jgi:arginine repressor
MSYSIVNFDHLPDKEVTVTLLAVPNRSGTRTVLKLVIHSKENKVIITLSEGQADRVAALIDNQLDPEIEKEA